MDTLTKIVFAIIGTIVIVSLFQIGNMGMTVEKKPNLTMKVWMDDGNEISGHFLTSEPANVTVCFKDIDQKALNVGTAGSESFYGVTARDFSIGYRDAFATGSGIVTVKAVTRDGRTNVTQLSV